MAIVDRFRSAWNAFRSSEENYDVVSGGTLYSGASPARSRYGYYNERSIISAIYNRIGMDVADVVLRHVQLDDSGRYLEDIESQLNSCLTLETNLDQAPRAFRQDVAMTLFDKGCAALVPVDTSVNPSTREVFDIFSIRVGHIVDWKARHVRVDVYNEDKGKRQEIMLEKKFVAIVENPLYTVMNEPNSTLQRLIRKLSILDSIDEQSGSGKLDMIIQLPYTVRSESRRQAAEKRLDDIEFQLKGRQYGIAYADATEKITQLNRPAENNLLTQIEYLINMLYGQLGITPEVMNGTADEAAMLNYEARTVKPIVQAIVEAMQRSFLGQTRTEVKNERISYFRDPFKLVPAKDLAEIADKFSRNEILTPNEIRGFMGIPPSREAKADKLENSNMPPYEPVTPSYEPVA